VPLFSRDEHQPPPAAPSSPTLSEHIGQNIESVVALQKKQWDAIGSAQKRVERVSRFLGRPLYLITLLAAIALWVGVNVFAAAASRWDPAPFELLDGVMTLISLVTTTIVLIAQNRQAKLEKQHTHLGLQVALLTEQKVTKVIKLLEELRRDMPMVKDRHDAHAEALQESADTAKVLAALEETGATQTGAPGAIMPHSQKRA
jgi:uncharacterized membrane protein